MQETHITLCYPKGRTHEDAVMTGECLEVGSEFELYGHTWRVVDLSVPRSRYDTTGKRLVCEIAEAALAA
jgi:hypothetical protein